MFPLHAAVLLQAEVPKRPPSRRSDVSSEWQPRGIQVRRSNASFECQQSVHVLSQLNRAKAGFCATSPEDRTHTFSDIP